MPERKHTPGPWRWEVNEKCKSMQLVGGRPKYDLTIMDFERWGMHGAAARMREPEVDGMNIMHRCTDWARAVPGREHHADWFKTIDHPDAHLIAAAPDLLQALEELAAMYARAWDTTDGGLHFSAESVARFEAAHEKACAAIAKATGQA